MTVTVNEINLIIITMNRYMFRTKRVISTAVENVLIEHSCIAKNCICYVPSLLADWLVWEQWRNGGGVMKVMLCILYILCIVCIMCILCILCKVCILYILCILCILCIEYILCILYILYILYIQLVYRYNFVCVEVAVCSLLFSQISEVFTNMYIWYEGSAVN